jgi:hypothetical protein
MPDLSHGMDEQVEAGARALYEHETRGTGALYGFDSLDDPTKETWRAGARAVLRSLPGSEARRQVEAVIPLIESVREFVTGTGPGGFKFDGKKLSDEAETELLCLIGQLPDLHRVLDGAPRESEARAVAEEMRQHAASPYNVRCVNLTPERMRVLADRLDRAPSDCSHDEREEADADQQG